MTNSFNGEMDKYPSDYWIILDQIININGITIDRPKGTRHPKYPDWVYNIDYGFINNTSSMDGNAIDIYVGTQQNKAINGIFCTIDTLKNDSEIKVVYECSAVEIEIIDHDLNNSKYMKAMFIKAVC